MTVPPTVVIRALRPHGRARRADLARLLGIEPSTVSRWRAGEVIPASKLAWLRRWNASPPDLQDALIFWADPRNFPNPEEED